MLTFPVCHMSGDATPPPPPPPPETLNALWDGANKGADITLLNGSLDAKRAVGSTTWQSLAGTVGHSSGLRYLEMEIIAAAGSNSLMAGLSDGAAGLLPNFLGNVDLSVGHQSNGHWRVSASLTENYTGVSSTLAVGDRVCLAADLGAGKVWFRKNGDAWINGDPVTGAGQAASGLTGATYLPAASLLGNASATSKIRLHPSNASFAHPIPSGFTSWNTA